MNETHLERIGTVLTGINYEMWCVFMFKWGKREKNPVRMKEGMRKYW